VRYVQDAFRQNIELELFVTALTNVDQRIAGAAQSHLVLDAQKETKNSKRPK